MMDDLISRKEALKVCEKYNGRGFIWSCIRGDIEKLPSAQPEQKKEKWIIVTDSRGQHAECPYCGEWKYHQNQKFCGECGCKMEVEE